MQERDLTDEEFERLGLKQLMDDLADKTCEDAEEEGWHYIKNCKARLIVVSEEGKGKEQC